MREFAGGSDISLRRPSLAPATTLSGGPGGLSMGPVGPVDGGGGGAGDPPRILSLIRTDLILSR